MTSAVLFDVWQDSAGVVTPALIKVQVQRWSNEFTTTSTTFVDVTGSSFSYTPRRTGSLLKITGELSVAPYNTTGSSTGMTYGLFVNGVEYGKQTGGHEVYIAVGSTASADFYAGHNVKSVFYTTTSTSAITINAKVKTHTSATTARINQAGNWESYIYVWEFAQ